MYPAGQTRAQQFDAEGRITSRCYAYTNPALNRCYTGECDAVGNPTRMTDPEGADGLSYDGIDRLLSNTRQAAAQPDSAETYDYNALGALKKNASIALDDQRVKLAGGGTADAAVMNSLGGQPSNWSAWSISTINFA